MTKEDQDVASAAIEIVKTLQPLAPDARARVLASAAALYGVDLVISGESEAVVPSDRDKAARAANPPQGGAKKPTSIVEFLKEKSPAANPQRLACFAYYREHHEGNKNFSSADLKPYFALAKLAPPGKNFARDYKIAIKEGWIHDKGSESFLTQTGERAVEQGFDGKARPRGATTGRKKRKGS